MPASTETPGISTDLPRLDAPAYQCGVYGEWSLMEKLGDSIEQGYFTNFESEPPGHYLVKNGHVWMSTSRLERESHAIHLKHARGNVVMCGVGMGLYSFSSISLS